MAILTPGPEEEFDPIFTRCSDSTLAEVEREMGAARNGKDRRGDAASGRGSLVQLEFLDQKLGPNLIING